MRYPELRHRLDGARSLSLGLVNAAEAHLAKGSDAPPAPAVLLAGSAAGAAVFTFSDRVWDAWLGNTAKLRGVKRIDAAPYATHPTRMALLCHWLLPEEGGERDDSEVIAILHDYLEEGDGFTPEAIAAMRRRFPREPAAAVAAVVLSEPQIDYDTLGPARELSSWRRVAYVVQAEDAVQRFGGRAFANAALVDKLDNLHDLGYIVGNRSLAPAVKAAKLAARLGYVHFVGEALADEAHPELLAAVREATAALLQEYGVTVAEVVAERDDLERRRQERQTQIQGMVREYHRSLGLTLV
jgi:(p)ppGpp synthase/HD superfamily hydrolase